jgi:hypothetical protein
MTKHCASVMRLVAASLGERPGEAALIWGRGIKTRPSCHKQT